jgi:hypothetical protein
MGGPFDRCLRVAIEDTQSLFPAIADGYAWIVPSGRAKHLFRADLSVAHKREK